jgi:hypothetical protein
LRRTPIIVAMLLGITGAVAGQTQPAQTPSQRVPAKTPAGKAPPALAFPSPALLLERYVKAMGGAEALRKITSRVVKGTFEIPGEQVTGTAEIDMASPDGFYSVLNIQGAGEFLQGYDGKVGWASDPGRGLRELSGQELAQMRRSSRFHHELHMAELYPKLRVVEKTMDGDRPVWVLEATPPEGRAERFYFDAETWLLLRHDSMQITPEGELPIEHRYAEYTKVDGVQVPTLLRHKDPGVEWQVKFTDIRNNVAIDPARFSLPKTP